jgi:general secretion pathway protein L
MSIGRILLRWMEIIAALFTDWRSARRAHKSLVVTHQNGQFTFRRSDHKAGMIAIDVAAGEALPHEILESLRNHIILLELGIEIIIVRHLTVPAQAQEFLADIVRNQIERLSPWPVAEAVYGFETKSVRNDGSNLKVRVTIASRASIEAVCKELKAIGITPDRIVAPVEADTTSTPINLWVRSAHGTPATRLSLPRLIGAGLAAVISISFAVSLWALFTTNSTRADYDEVSRRIADLEGSGQTMRRPLKAAERAWVLKETSPVAVFTIDALTRALPDSAYVTQLRLENATLHITGLATDAPSLIAALETSRRFSAVHFYAPTTKDLNGDRYRFFIEARITDALASKEH